MNPYNSNMIVVMIACSIHIFDDCFSHNTENWPKFILHKEIYLISLQISVHIKRLTINKLTACEPLKFRYACISLLPVPQLLNSAVIIILQPIVRLFRI